MSLTELNRLMQEYLSDKISESDFMLLWETVSKEEYAAFWKENIDLLLQNPSFHELADESMLDIAWAKAKTELMEAPVTVMQPLPRISSYRKLSWVAALLVVALGISVYFWLGDAKNENIAVENSKKLDVVPGRNGAILTLSDGSEVVLDSLNNGQIATQNGAQVLLNNGRLAYAASGNADGGLVYNTMSTPNGRTFQVTLPDGTEVWLNAASSIRFPTAFIGKERKVEVTGEAYFEVVKSGKPFIVNVDRRSTVTVLGTHFNINSYRNEDKITTTLLSGSVKVESKSMSAVIKPGEQALVADGLEVVKDADVDKVMAWKNGFFNFEDASLKEVMKQLERWYDIEVEYEKGIPDIYFVGKMSRNVKLSGLLKVLEASKVHFRLEEGRKLVVLP